MLNKLLEGLRPLDLKEMIEPIFEIDSFKSKMGEDKDVCVLSFVVADRFPARDLMEFIEKGYNFVLDADVSAGEDKEGRYHVFVELSRTPRLSEQIKDLTYGVRKLTGIDDFKFRYHKKDGEFIANEQELRSIVPLTPEAYESFLNEVKTENVKKFFSKTLMDDLSLEGNVITIHKPFNQKIQMRWLPEEKEIVEETISVDEASTAEIFWMTKVLGDYEITKFGDKFLFTNGDQNMILQRI